ncbi:hypothetical protein HP550_00950 [Cellulomonas humilata]|uniref:Uncharacterized protein n=1 Tax=Cellulomonas humilata TaxID=144055 RepID=A0A7Y6DVR6_9CELL|nr:hypothetical protein [Cellulomonas humilata]NUU15818.1 hypothetical protein [Cellulomonas humilata]
MDTLVMLTFLNGYITSARHRIRDHSGGDAGASTLELVIIILGLIAVAGVLVVAVTAAVQRRVDQIT